MKSAIDTIKQYNMFKKGETVAVAVSGGIDSICLLHFLYSNKKNWGIDVMAVNVDHQIRENSNSDSQFVYILGKAILVELISDFSKWIV